MGKTSQSETHPEASNHEWNNNISFLVCELEREGQQHEHVVTLSHSQSVQVTQDVGTCNLALCSVNIRGVFITYINGHRYMKRGMSSMLHTRAGKQQLFAVLNQSTFYHQYLVINNNFFL